MTTCVAMNTGFWSMNAVIRAPIVGCFDISPGARDFGVFALWLTSSMYHSFLPSFARGEMSKHRFFGPQMSKIGPECDIYGGANLPQVKSNAPSLEFLQILLTWRVKVK